MPFSPPPIIAPFQRPQIVQDPAGLLDRIAASYLNDELARPDSPSPLGSDENGWNAGFVRKAFADAKLSTKMETSMTTYALHDFHPEAGRIAIGGRQPTEHDPHYLAIRKLSTGQVVPVGKLPDR